MPEDKQKSGDLEHNSSKQPQKDLSFENTPSVEDSSKHMSDTDIIAEETQDPPGIGENDQEEPEKEQSLPETPQPTHSIEGAEEPGDATNDGLSDNGDMPTVKQDRSLLRAARDELAAKDNEDALTAKDEDQVYEDTISEDAPSYRKRTLTERITASVQAIKLNGNHKKDDFTDLATVVMPVPVVAKSTHSSALASLPGYSGAGHIGALPALRRRKMLRHISRKHMRQSREKQQSIVKRVLVTLLCLSLTFIVVFLTISGVGSYASYRLYTDTQSQFQNKVTNLRDALPKDNLKIYDRNNIMIAQMLDERLQTSIALKDVPKDLQNATVAIEDKSFWTNYGIDFARIISAAIENLKQGKIVEGGSTITQQLIKNIVVGDQREALRKLQELMLIPQVNNQFSKEEILEMYLNTIPYGTANSSKAQVTNAIGINAAAQMYFGLEDKPGKPAASQLTLAQSAMLAGIPNAPSLYNPFLNAKAAKQRMAIVLDLMVNSGYISNAKAKAAMAEANKPDFLKSGNFVFNNRAPHFSEYVLRELQKQYKVDRADLSVSGMSVYTTLDLKLQDKVVKFAKEHINNIKGTYGVSNAAGVILDQHTGAILTLFGSIDPYNKAIQGQFDVATQGMRQPGSSFKPYVYATALEMGVSPGQAIDDNELIIPLVGNVEPTYEPKNYDRKFHGAMTMRCAIQNSLNIPAVKTLQYVGIDKAFNKAKQMGLTKIEGTPGYSMVLGGLGVNLLEHTSAFGSFGNSGVHVPYYSIEKIKFEGASTKDFAHKKDAGKRVLSPQVAYMMTDMLTDNNARIPQFGQCSPLYLYTTSEYDCYAGNPGQVRRAAVKTGTTDNFVDNWTMGYTTDYMMGVWVGNNDNTAMINATGIVGAAPIWHQGILYAEEGKPVRDFQNPGGIQKQGITFPNGVRTTDWFLPGKYPTFNQTYKPTPTAVTKPGKNKVNPPAASRPYCYNYDYAFNPPASSTTFEPNRGWW